MKRNAKCPPPTGVDELPKTAQRAGTAEPADYRPVPRLVFRIATEPICRSTIEIIEARKHAPLIPLTPSSSSMPSSPQPPPLSPSSPPHPANHASVPPPSARTSHRRLVLTH